ncbi:hypothetical protein EniyanLRS_38 [Mycobacterium phage EniyanLRS]|uniref:Uncharacterized protein n=2 Tax=Mycobacterium virus Wildcat TaxID=1993859 RepID=A0A0B4ZZU1_9CAUD|nr:hypothetical protein COSMO_41 [Mycobacterium phage Cosmo]AQT25713.1 hypothetical protein EniyanLRS_38 [Mycobacterium phage EniyanLRS]WKR36051.1 hypothetical protein [Mycobacterium phage Azrael100]
MIEVIFRASNDIEGVSAKAIHEAMEDLGLDLITSPAGYVVHVHNLDCIGLRRDDEEV